MSRLIIRPGTSELRVICRNCREVIEPGEELVTFLYDGNPVGTGPSDFITNATRDSFVTHQSRGEMMRIDCDWCGSTESLSEHPFTEQGGGVETICDACCADSFLCSICTDISNTRVLESSQSINRTISVTTAIRRSWMQSRYWKA